MPQDRSPRIRCRMGVASIAVGVVVVGSSQGGRRGGVGAAVVGWASVGVVVDLRRRGVEVVGVGRGGQSGEVGARVRVAEGVEGRGVSVVDRRGGVGLDKLRLREQ